MLRTNAPRAIRHLRRRRSWRQQDLATAAGVSRQAVSRLELGENLGATPLRTVTRLVECLDASVELTVRWHGEELDRLLDAGHSGIVEECVRLVEGLGWHTRLEVSFNHYGDRGRVDLLAIHPVTRALLVLEAKTAIGDLQDTLGRLDVKARLGTVLAASVGWEAPSVVVPALAVGDSRSARRLVSSHDAALARFALRGRRAWAWVRRPHGVAPSGLLWFVNVPNAHAAGITRYRRVRTVKSGR